MTQTSDARGLWGALLAAQDRWPRCRRRHPGLEAVLLCPYLDPSRPVRRDEQGAPCSAGRGRRIRSPHHELVLEAIWASTGTSERMERVEARVHRGR